MKEGEKSDVEGKKEGHEENRPNGDLDKERREVPRQ